MTVDEELRPLAPAARKVHWIASFVGAAILAAVVTAVDLLWDQKFDAWPFEPGEAAVVLAPLLLLHAAVYPPFWYRAWRYAVREHDVLLRHGVIWRTQRSIPRRRIQHVDVQSGPIDRAYGLADLTLYTAGADDEENQIPGLLVEEAEALRDRLVRDDPAESWERSGFGPHG